jgi:hypothetical protein
VFKRPQRCLIERTSDSGDLSFAGATLGAISYTLEIWQTFQSIRTGTEVETVVGPPHIDVRIDKRQLKRLTPWPEGAMLTLQLKDGRRVDGFIRGERFVPSGSITSRTGAFEPQPDSRLL